MPNSYVNKVQFVRNGTTETLIDLTSDTVSASTLAQGYTAHDATGALITGTLAEGTHGGTVWQDENGYVHVSDEAWEGMPSGTISISSNGTVDVSAYASASVSVQPNLQTATKSYTPSETAQSETITADSSHDGLSSVSVSVGAISSNYVGSGVPRKSSSDLTASGATVTAPAGYYAEAATKSVSSMTLPTSTSGSGSGTSKATVGRSTSDQYINIPTGYNSSAAYYKVSAVANGTEGTPTATKGTVSNHSVSVTPSVTNSAGYIAGGTHSGTAVTVSASELVSGSQTITTNDTYDVTNLAEVVVSVSGGSGSGWQTMHDGNVWVNTSSPNWCAVDSYTTPLEADQTYRVTWGSDEYVCDTVALQNASIYDGYYIGNLAIVGGSQSANNEPFFIYRDSSTRLLICTSTTGEQNIYFKLELQVEGGATLITKSITQNGTYNALDDDADGYSSVTVNVSGGGGDNGSMSDPIRFFDYDGTLVASYSSVPSSLPSVPTHTGLTGGAWNHTLQQVTTQFNAMGTCDVGANYDTTSGATEIDVEFIDDARLAPYLKVAVNGTVEIDWGDNSSAESVTGTSLTTAISKQHTYSSVGKYTIKISPSSGTGYTLVGNNSAGMLSAGLSGVSKNCAYTSAVHKVRLGSGVRIGSYAFRSCVSLETISISPTSTGFLGDAFFACPKLRFVAIPSGITEVSTEFVRECRTLRAISMPTSLTGIGTTALRSCEALASVSIPHGVTSIPATMFYSCYSLATITVPSGVTSIGASAFYDCGSVAEYHIKPTTPPTLENVNAFSSGAPDLKIYVPSAKLADYQAAENWSTYASYMVGE